MKIGVIGCGKRMSGLVRGLKAIAPELEFMIADPDSNCMDRWLATKDFDVESIPRFADADALLEHADELSGVMVGTRCKDHTEMAIKVAASGLPMFLEKPVSISFEQLNELVDRDIVGRIIPSDDADILPGHPDALVSFPYVVRPL